MTNKFLAKYGQVPDNPNFEHIRNRQLQSSPEKLGKIVDSVISNDIIGAHGATKMIKEAIRASKYDKENHDKLFDRYHQDKEFFHSFVDSPRLDSNQISKMIDNHGINSLYTTHPSFNSEHLDRFIKEGESGHLEHLADRKDLTQQQKNDLYDALNEGPRKDAYGKLKFIKTQELTSPQIHDVIDNSASLMNATYNGRNPIQHILNQKALSDEHTNKLLVHRNPDVIAYTLSHLKKTKQQNHS